MINDNIFEDKYVILRFDFVLIIRSSSITGFFKDSTLEATGEKQTDGNKDRTPKNATTQKIIQVRTRHVYDTGKNKETENKNSKFDPKRKKKCKIRRNLKDRASKTTETEKHEGAKSFFKNINQI